MFTILTILAEFLFVALLIVVFYRLKHRFGLAPLFVLLGSILYFQTILFKSNMITIFGEYQISPGATILFSASLFTVLLIYIKEGVRATRNLILAIILANLFYAVFARIVDIQMELLQSETVAAKLARDIFHFNIRSFIVGTALLIFDAFILVILYEYFLAKIKWLNLFSRVPLALLIILNIDAILFVTGSFWGSPGIGNIVTGQIIGKSVAALLFATVLFIYLRFFDKDKNNALDEIEKGNEDILSILTYKGRFERLQTEKAISDEQLQLIISEKTAEQEKALRRHKILATVRELRIDKFSTAEQAHEFLIKVREAFEVDACTIHLIKNEELQMLSSIGIEEENKVFKMMFTFPYFNKIIAEKQTLCIEDTRADPNIYTEFLKDPNIFKYKSCAGAPLFSGKKVIGLLKLYSVHTNRSFTNLEMEHLQLVASQIAHAIEANQLFEQNEKHKEVLVKQIVARKKVEEAIKESETKYRTLVEQASDGIIISNEKLELVEANSMICRMLGYSKEEILNISFLDIAKTFPLNASSRYEKLTTGNPILHEIIFNKKNRSHLTAEVSTIMMQDGNFLSFIRDITERKKADEEKQVLLTRNLQTINTMLDGFILADENGKIIEVNPAYCKMIGFSREELLQKNIKEIEATLITKEDIERRSKEILQKKSIQFETKHLRRDKEIIDLEVNVSIMVFNEQPLVTAFVRDITERKKTEAQIIDYNQQLQNLAAHLLSIREEERKRIGREIHDDLGQQLTAIKMDVAWIDKNIPAETVPIKNKLKNIIHLLDGSNQSVRRILSELKPSILDEYGLQDAIIWHSKQFTENTGIPVKFTSSDNDIRLTDDVATCIFRVFQESMTNIARHASAKNVIITLKLIQNQIIVTIEDDGKGFDTKQVKGKGSFGLLGMSERVRALSGNLSINSIIGSGTAIIVTFPYMNN